MKVIAMNIGKAIRLCRVQKSLSQADLAESVGLTASMISMIETGKREVSLSLLNRISKALAIPIPILTYLATEEGDLKEESPEFKEAISKIILDLIRALK